MATPKHAITIKGTKDGLHFYFDSAVAVAIILRELEKKLHHHNNQTFMQGPLTHVHLHFGTLHLDEEQIQSFVTTIESAGSFLVKDVHTDIATLDEVEKQIERALPKIITHTVRSGQVIESEHDILVLGDVNPGGWVVSAGNVYIMGAMKGYAHAGAKGDSSKIIAASLLAPMQLRIADSIATSFSALTTDAVMKFAYIEEGHFDFASIQLLEKIRPNSSDTILTRS